MHTCKVTVLTCRNQHLINFILFTSTFLIIFTIQTELLIFESCQQHVLFIR